MDFDDHSALKVPTSKKTSNANTIYTIREETVQSEKLIPVNSREISISSSELQICDEEFDVNLTAKKCRARLSRKTVTSALSSLQPSRRTKKSSNVPFCNLDDLRVITSIDLSQDTNSHELSMQHDMLKEQDER